jgi:DNA topoisomerase VI subunit B
MSVLASHGASSAPKLERETFSTSREMDFFSTKELQTQTGHAVLQWPLVIVKELIDNALDACEEDEVAPTIQIAANANSISVRDNGPGMPTSTLIAQQNFATRTSSREAYISPTRGAQGNALKVLLAMPHIIDPDHGKLVIEANCKRHVITCGKDSISQRPSIKHDESNISPRKGTLVRLEWSTVGDGVWPFLGLTAEYFKSQIRSMMEGFALFNPHATFSLNWFDEMTGWKATNTSWPKWRPSDPTSAHHYELAHLERLIGACITHDRELGKDRLVSDFLAEFDGLARSAKQSKVLNATNMKRMKLSDLVINNDLDRNRITILLSAMQEHTKPVSSDRLGVIGAEHLKTRLLGMGCQPDSFRYIRKVAKLKSTKSGSSQSEKASFIPFVLEAAFGWLGKEAPEERKIFNGVNWSAMIANPFRSFGATGQGLEAALAEMKVGAEEPIIFALHLAHPRIEYTDRGKSALIIGDEAATVNARDIQAVVFSVTKEWTKARKAEERGRSKANRQFIYSDRVCFSHVAPEILPAGYAHASGNGQFTVDKRQFYYACRDEFFSKTGKHIDSDYFSQDLIVRFMNRYPDETAHWRITASPRGTLTIPNAGFDARIPCGTIAIGEHLSAAEVKIDPLGVNIQVPNHWPSLAGGQRYQAVLYIEKEGFDPQLRESRLAERFDIAIISCKGQSVVAARKYADHVCRVDGGVPVFVLHDFDPAGFSICQNLTEVSERARENDLVKYEFQNKINVVDLGLRLTDVLEYELKSENFTPRSIPENASGEEREFFRSGRRVEINAFTAPQFIQFLETKLTLHLPTKFVPADDILMAAYRRAVVINEINAAVEMASASAIRKAAVADVPASLRQQIEDSKEPWDIAVYNLAKRVVQPTHDVPEPGC